MNVSFYPNYPKKRPLQQLGAQAEQNDAEHDPAAMGQKEPALFHIKKIIGHFLPFIQCFPVHLVMNEIPSLVCGDDLRVPQDSEMLGHRRRRYVQGAGQGVDA
jgi:hypothetical protein